MHSSGAGAGDAAELEATGIPVYMGEPKETPKGGTFQGFMAEVESVEHCDRVLEAIRAHKKAKKAKYRMFAYR